MSSALDAILSDTDSMLEVAVEIDSAKRSDGTLKTWYYSTNPRGIDPPATEEFKPFLRQGGVLGPLSQSLSEDVMFSGLAENNPGTLTLIQSVVDNDQLSQFNDYVFAGYRVRIKVGRITDLYASFVTYRTITVNVDPSVQLTTEGLKATFNLSSVNKRMLDENLIIPRYVGIPHCLRFMTTAAGVITATKQSGHDVSRFTIGLRFRAPSNPPAGTTRRLWTKCATSGISANSHWFLRIETAGTLNLLSSSNLANDINYTSPTSLCDGHWHHAIFSRDNNVTAYIMIDYGTEVVFVPLGNVDLSNFNLIWGQSSGNTQLEIQDARFLDRYMTPDEARGYFPTRSNGDDLNVIGLWRFDDNTGAAVNDYSTLNADGAITGTVNTDYAWKESDLGEPELAGKPFPLGLGNLLNAKADLIDIVRERYRGNADSTGWFSSGSNSTLTVRSQGTVLTGGGVDYTAPSNGGDGVFSTTSQEAEPVTFDLLNDGTAEENIYPSSLAHSLLTSRTRLLSADIANYQPLQVLCPWPSGYHTDEDTTAQQALQEILGESGLHYYEGSSGSLWMDMFLPPTGYGPYGESCLDFRGGEANRVSWGDLADVSGSCTIVCWVKLQILDQTAYNWNLNEPNQGSLFFVTKGGLSGNYTLMFQAIGLDAGKIKFRTAGTTLSTPAGIISGEPAWHFVAGVFDDVGNTNTICLAKKGSNLVSIVSGANSGSQSTNSLDIQVGNSGSSYPWISVGYAQVWSGTKTLAQLQSLMTTPPIGNESGLLFFAPLAGDLIDKVSSTVGTSTYGGNGYESQWAPKLIVNLDDTPSVKLTDFHHSHPAWNVIVNYAKNRFKMSESDIDTGVSRNARLALTREGLDVKFESTKIRDRFKGARKVSFDSPITDQESATRLLRSIQSRFGTDNYVGMLTFPPGLNISRLACGLTIGDEIGLVGNVPSQIQTPRSFRVASVAHNPLQLSTSIVIVG